jgi:hypothetical protein
VSSTPNSTSNAEVAEYYNRQLPHMKNYENGRNGRLNRINQSLTQVIVPGVKLHTPRHTLTVKMLLI